MSDESTVLYTTSRRLVAEALGTCLLVATVVGSGIMAETLAGGNVAIALLGNTIATGAILFVLIHMLGPISGAHFNPAVTIALSVARLFPWRDVPVYIVVQIVGGLVGTMLAHLMFQEPLLTASTTVRTGGSQWLAEAVAAFGLVATILALVRFRPDAVATGVALFITAGYWFTSSTSFANPAVAIARSLTDTFSGIRPADMPAFIVAEIVGAVLAAWLFAWLLGPRPAAGDK